MFQRDDSVLAVGMTDGLLSIQHRKPSEVDSAEKTSANRSKDISYRYRLNQGAFAKVRTHIKPTLCYFQLFEVCYIRLKRCYTVRFPYHIAKVK